MRRVLILIVLVSLSAFSKELYRNSILGGVGCALAQYRPIPYLSLSYERIGNRFNHSISLNRGIIYFEREKTKEEFSTNFGIYYALQFRFLNYFSIGPLSGFLFSNHSKETMTGTELGGIPLYRETEFYSYLSFSGGIASFSFSHKRLKIKIENKLLIGFNSYDCKIYHIKLRDDFGISVGLNFGRKMQ